MSERTIIPVLLACAALVAPVEGQSVPELQRREAELTARLARLHAQEAAAVERRFLGQQRTILSSGTLRVAYPTAALHDVPGSVTALLDSQRVRYGSAIDSILADTLFIDLGDVPEHPTWRIGSLAGEVAVDVPRTRGAEWIAAVTGPALRRWALELLDPGLREWLGGLDPRATIATVRDPLVRDLLNSPSSRARRCLLGALTDCRQLLELGEAGTPRLEAYDREDLPVLIGRLYTDPRIPGRANCVGKRDPEACAELVRQGWVLPPHPVSTRARQSLFAYALASGGAGAWVRLHRSQGLPVAAQLSAAAGRPVDSLVAEWQHDLRAGERTSAAGLGTSLLLASVWGVLTTLFFAWRYRWRHV